MFTVVWRKITNVIVKLFIHVHTYVYSFLKVKDACMANVQCIYILCESNLNMIYECFPVIEAFTFYVCAIVATSTDPLIQSICLSYFKTMCRHIRIKHAFYVTTNANTYIYIRSQDHPSWLWTGGARNVIWKRWPSWY